MGRAKERPIIFNAEMVRAILDGRKTQTRRPIQTPAKNMQKNGHKVIEHRDPGDKWYKDRVWSMRNSMGVWGDFTHEEFLSKCPFGQLGDKLWVRETFQFYSSPGSDDGQVIFNNVTDSHHWHVGPLSGDIPSNALEGYFNLVDKCQRRNGVMFKVPSIHMPRWASRVLLEITDIRVERIKDISVGDAMNEGINHKTMNCPKHEFFQLWNSIYGDMGHERNDWVWVVEFKRVESEG